MIEENKIEKQNETRIQDGKKIVEFEVEDKVIRFECPMKKQKNKKDEKDKVIEDDSWSQESNEVVRYYMEKYGK